MKKYDHQKLEAKWRKIWEDSKIYRTPEDATRENKLYILPQLPYPSGAGLHVGHAEIYMACDIYARFQRMRGKKVLQTIGWDAFGLPAENYAIKTNIHPRINTDKAIDNFREQIKSLGISVDWERSVGSHNPDYYKWTQWFFLLMLERGLAYRKKQAVNWCETDKTVLANEQVIDGKCERCGTVVVQKEMEQWFLKITEYADRLIEDLDKVDWPAETKKRQRDWIGRSKGAQLQFRVNDSKLKVEVFTTRPDTIFGATFLVLAPEHSLVQELKDKIKNWKEVEAYVKKALLSNELERQQEKEKTGVILEGITVENPATNEQIPVYIGDYVLANYGAGALMAVPAHDERDFAFAYKYNLPIVRVIKPENLNKSIILKQSVHEDFIEKLKQKDFEVSISNKGHYQVKFSDKQVDEYVRMIREHISQNFFVDVIGSNNLVIFHDMVFSTDTREGELKAVKEITERFPRLAKTSNLSTLMAFQFGDEQENSHFYRDTLIYAGDGVMVNSHQFNKLKSQEAWNAIVEWLNALNVAELKTNYKLRDWSVSRQRFWGAPTPIVYDPQGNAHPVALEDLPVILPDDVDFKPTGQSPLTYSEGFHKGVEAKYGKGWHREVDTLDTFMCSSWYYFRYLDPKNDKAFASKEALDKWMPVDFYLGGTEHVNGHLLYSRFFTKVLYDAGYINFDEPFLVHRHQGTILGPDGRKMSKRWGNVINPTDVVRDYGADAAKVYEMFMGPLEQDKAWSDSAVQGVRRFLQRVHDFGGRFKKNSKQGNVSPMLHKLIKKATLDTEKLRLNVVIAEFMKTLNSFEEKDAKVSRADWETYLQLLAPYAPFLTEEMWQLLGNKESVHLQSWPDYDPNKILEENVKIVIQVNGKLRDTLEAPAGISQKEVEELVKTSEKAQKFLLGEKVKKVIYVQDKLISFVI